MSHVTHIKESCNIYEWAMLHIWMSHVTHMNEPCHTCERVISRMWMSHVAHMNESCHTYEWLMSHVWMSHVTHMNESCHTYEWFMKHRHGHGWVMSHIWLSHGTHLNDSWNTSEHVRVVTLWYVRRASFMCVQSLVHMCAGTCPCAWQGPIYIYENDSSMRVAMGRLYVLQECFHICDVIRLYACHESRMHVK